MKNAWSSLHSFDWGCEGANIALTAFVAFMRRATLKVAACPLLVSGQVWLVRRLGDSVEIDVADKKVGA